MQVFKVLLHNNISFNPSKLLQNKEEWISSSPPPKLNTYTQVLFWDKDLILGPIRAGLQVSSFLRKYSQMGIIVIC